MIKLLVRASTTCFGYSHSNLHACYLVKKLILFPQEGKPALLLFFSLSPFLLSTAASLVRYLYRALGYRGNGEGGLGQKAFQNTDLCGECQREL
jgi:hypothetical protein